MPIYLYECDSCGVRFELMQRIADDPLTDCPECDGHVHRIIQPVGIIFKGSGFYVTDNRRGSSPTLAPPKEHDKLEEKKTSSTVEPKVETAAPKDTATKDD